MLRQKILQNGVCLKSLIQSNRCPFSTSKVKTTSLRRRKPTISHFNDDTDNTTTHSSSTPHQNNYNNTNNVIPSTSFQKMLKSSSQNSASTPSYVNNNNNSQNSITSIDTTNHKSQSRSSSFLFTPKDKNGIEIPIDEYLTFASLSPWVPCPEPVARKVLDIARASSNDVHYELGSGDGRLNFQAIDFPYQVQKSIGIDIDPSLIQTSNERIMKRHPYPTNIEFICADLLPAMSNSKSDSNSSNDSGCDLQQQQQRLWEQMSEECTILTMYFVQEALDKLKPTLEQYFMKESSKCRIITIGYEMKGWEPSWVEAILGLNIYLYEMKQLYTLSQITDTINHNHHDDDLNPLSTSSSLDTSTSDSAGSLRISDVGLTPEEELLNPFSRGNRKQVFNSSTLPTLEYHEYDEESMDVDYHWDFDENEPVDDDDDSNHNNNSNNDEDTKKEKHKNTPNN